ncbi:MAG: hypothetical protein NC930_02555 [Candidatus Omnitrophica bacterium]|nr:hypothetical protein [Candidatus Omnitrophota bacterium]
MPKPDMDKWKNWDERKIKKAEISATGMIVLIILTLLILGSGFYYFMFVVK